MKSLLKSNNMTQRPRRLCSPPPPIRQPSSHEPSAFQLLNNYFSDFTFVPKEEISPEGKRRRLQIVENQIRAYKKKKLLDLASSFPGCKAKSAMYKDQIITAVAESYLNSLDGRVSQDDDVVIIDITEEAMNDNNNVDVTNVACDA